MRGELDTDVKPEEPPENPGRSTPSGGAEPEPVEIGTFRGALYLLPFALLFWLLVGVLIWQL